MGVGVGVCVTIGVGIGVSVGVGLGVEVAVPVGLGVNVGIVVGGAVTLNPMVAVAGSKCRVARRSSRSARSSSGTVGRQRARGVAFGVGGAETGMPFQRELDAGADDWERPESRRRRSARPTSVTGLPTITVVGLRFSVRKLVCCPDGPGNYRLVGRQVGCCQECGRSNRIDTRKNAA